MPAESFAPGPERLGSERRPRDDNGEGRRRRTRDAFDRLLAELRPKLHRYCARMTGSVIDGEDVVQEALVKAIEALGEAGALANPEGWLFRIAHNAALDFLRRRARQEAPASDEDPDMIADPQRQPTIASPRRPACAPSCACRWRSAPASS